MSRLYPGFGSNKKGVFEGTYVAHSLAMSGRDDMEGGDKVIMPQSAFRDVSRMKLPFPLTFAINNARKKRGPASKGPFPSQQYCGVMEFSAPEDQVFLPFWMMKNLKVREGGRVQLKSVIKGTIPKGVSCRIQPHKTEFIDMAATMDIRTLLEQAFRNYSVLTTGETICVMFFGTKYMLEVIETSPESAISLYGNLDLEVDFAPPLDSTTPGKIRPNNMNAAEENEASGPESGSPAEQRKARPSQRRGSSKSKSVTRKSTARRGSHSGMKGSKGVSAATSPMRKSRGNRVAQSPPTPPSEEQHTPRSPPKMSSADAAAFDAASNALAAAAIAAAQQQAAASTTVKGASGHQWGGGQSLSGTVVAPVTVDTSTCTSVSNNAVSSATPAVMPRRAPGKFSRRNNGSVFTGGGNSLSLSSAPSSAATSSESVPSSFPVSGGRRLSASSAAIGDKDNAVFEMPRPTREEMRARRMQFFEAQQAAKKAMEDGSATPRGSALDAIRRRKESKDHN